jgi:hypothetical protein
MSDADKMGFGKFVPGFDFLQNLAKGAGSNIPQMPNLANWVAPTMNMEELDKRIEELKGVHFWLEQNSRALGATIQALEVQKMTLATLTGMNFNLGDMANALKLKAADSVVSGVQRVTEKAATTAKTISSVASSASKGDAKGAAKAAGVPGLVDPMQLWGALTQQFQTIAATAMKEAGTKTAVDMTRHMATGLAKEALKSASSAGRKAATKKTTARKAPAKKSSKRPS